MNCYYCNSPANDADEHIPPKALYKGNNVWLNGVAMQNLLTVPSCVKHNKDTSTDDDLFVYLVADIACANHFAANVLAAQVNQLAIMSKSDYDMFKQRMMLLNCTPLNSQGRIFDTGKVTREAKLTLMRKVAVKIYRGIHYHLHNVFYPRADDQLVDEWFFLGESGELERINRKTAGWAKPQPIVSGDPEVFRAEYFHGGRLKLVFYSQIVCVVCLTGTS